MEITRTARPARVEIGLQQARVMPVTTKDARSSDVSGRPITIAALFALSACLTPLRADPPATAAPDPLGREDPRSSVTGFLEECRNQNFQKAAEYLDLRQFSAKYRAQQGPDLARRLDQILNSDGNFTILRLSRNPAGSLADDTDPNREHVATINQNGQMLTLDLERSTPQTGGPQVWLFSRDTVVALPKINVATAPSAIETYLPKVLVTRQILATPLWKWIALIVAASVIIALSRLMGWLVALLLKPLSKRSNRRWKVPWLPAVMRPLRVIVGLMLFRIGLVAVAPSAISRIYIGRVMEIIFVGSIAWCLVRLTDLLMNHFESRLDASQQYSSRTMIRLGRRTAAATIVVFAILFVLQSWGYNTSTLIAGLGVGGIAVALAAQQTIANVFGGVSLIGDHPIRIGEYGKFGDMEGVVEDIGMRSTRVRTTKRTIVSVPNSTFAGLNLENYSIRDKILFNPKFEIRRGTTESQVHALIEAIEKLISSRRELEKVQTPARVVALSSASFSLEIFCYVLTADVNAFYRIQGDLLMAINNIFAAASVELV